MRRMLCTLVLSSVLLIAVGMGIGRGGPIPPQATPPLSTVIFLGDSLTQGQHTDDFYYDYTWQTVLGLRARSSADASQYLVDGVGGDTTGQFLAHLQALDLHPSNAQLIVLELGTNDYLQQVPPATMQAHYAALLAWLATDNPNARLVALSVWGDPAAAAAYNSVIQAEAATWTGAGGRALVDISTLYLNPSYHWPPGSSDTFHPNDAGHVAIAQAVLAVA
ncbi:MAG TPA: SGNH/GDSL hydrolase family protein [Ktedonobacterales bacterium]|nr:SGNH/GDSL hydrolase family protein [Ktedonobacterales bacterium]